MNNEAPASISIIQTPPVPGLPVQNEEVFEHCRPPDFDDTRDDKTGLIWVKSFWPICFYYENNEKIWSLPLKYYNGEFCLENWADYGFFEYYAFSAAKKKEYEDFKRALDFLTDCLFPEFYSLKLNDVETIRLAAHKVLRESERQGLILRFHEPSHEKVKSLHSEAEALGIDHSSIWLKTDNNEKPEPNINYLSEKLIKAQKPWNYKAWEHVGRQLSVYPPVTEDTRVFMIPIMRQPDIASVFDFAHFHISTSWSANKQARRGDICLLYHGQRNPNFFPQRMGDPKWKEIFSASPGAIFGTARILLNAFNTPDPTFWRWWTLIGDFFIYPTPISIKKWPEAKPLLLNFFNPRALIKEEPFFAKFLTIDAGRSPHLKDEEIESESSFWPSKDDTDEVWSGKMKLISTDKFLSEIFVRGRFGMALIARCFPENCNIETNFHDPEMPNKSIDLMISKRGRRLPLIIRLNFDIKKPDLTDSEKYYLRTQENGCGLLIAESGVFQISLKGNLIRPLFFRTNVSSICLERLRLWASEFFAE